MVVLSVKNITKRFTATVALSNVSVSFEKGTIHGICGENGAGKSTLGKIIFGVYQPDEGRIFFNGDEVTIPNPYGALKMGISESFQETYFIPELSVAENIFLVDIPMRKNMPVISWKKMFESTQTLLDSLSMEIDARIPMRKLSVAETVLVSIAKAIHHNSDLIVLDEPTASFNFTEVENLFSLMRMLKERGVVTIFISHKLSEVLEITDMVTVLRDGEKIKTIATEKLNVDRLTSMMCGRELELDKKMHSEGLKGEKLLTVKGISGEGYRDVSFDLHAGEILGIGGLMGSGKDEFIRELINGDYRMGSISVRGKELIIRSPIEAQKNGIGYVPPDRHLEGLVPMLSVRNNIYMRNPAGKAFFINKRLEKKLSQQIAERVLLKAPLGVEQLVSTLSGGNQQKVLMARILASNSDILVLHEPTRGIDVGAKAEMHKLMRAIVKEGKGIVLCSSETEELVSMSNRVLVMRNCHVVADYEGEFIDEAAIVKSSLQG